MKPRFTVLILLLGLLTATGGCALSYYYPTYSRSERASLELAEAQCLTRSEMKRGVVLETCVLESLSE